jgi:hypothetical protein
VASPKYRLQTKLPYRSVLGTGIGWGARMDKTQHGEPRSQNGGTSLSCPYA